MGEKGYLLGWAYEAEPNKPIIAKPLNSLSETAASPVSDFTYKVQEGKVTILGYKGSEPNVEIPATIEDTPVMVIGSHSFYDTDTLETVIIPDSVTEIEVGAFRQCANLRSVSIGKNVSIIGGYVFERCPSLETLLWVKAWLDRKRIYGMLLSKNHHFPFDAHPIWEWLMIVRL